jgi:uncharacterized protein HemX
MSSLPLTIRPEACGTDFEFIKHSQWVNGADMKATHTEGGVIMKFATTALLLGFGIFLAGCQKNEPGDAMRKAADKMNEAADKMDQASKDAAEKARQANEEMKRVGEQMQKTGEEVKNKAESAANQLKNDAGDALQKAGEALKSPATNPPPPSK